MPWEKAEGEERQAGLATEQERAEIVADGAAKIATAIRTLLEKMMREDGTTFWDNTPEGKKRYMATLLYETAKELGLSPDEVKGASAEKLW